jgi:hypothetical protein
MTNTNPTNLYRTLGELDGGVLEAQANHALSDVALAVRAIDGTKVKGKLTIQITVERAKGSGQLLVTHKLSLTKPTDTGRTSEEANGETLMYCSAKGALSVVPEAQGRLDFTHQETPNK